MPKRFDKCLQCGPGSQESSRLGDGPIAPTTPTAPSQNHGGAQHGAPPTNEAHFEPFLESYVRTGKYGVHKYLHGPKYRLVLSLSDFQFAILGQPIQAPSRPVQQKGHHLAHPPNITIIKAFISKTHLMLCLELLNKELYFKVVDQNRSFTVPIFNFLRYFFSIQTL